MYAGLFYSLYTLKMVGARRSSNDFSILIVFLWEEENAFHPSSGARHWVVCYHRISCQMEETELWIPKPIKIFSDVYAAVKPLDAESNFIPVLWQNRDGDIAKKTLGFWKNINRLWEQGLWKKTKTKQTQTKATDWGKKCRPKPLQSAQDCSDKSEWSLGRLCTSQYQLHFHSSSTQ